MCVCVCVCVCVCLPVCLPASLHVSQFLSVCAMMGLFSTLHGEFTHSHNPPPQRSKGSIWEGMTSQVDIYNGHRKMLDDIFETVPLEFRDILLHCRYTLGRPELKGGGML